MLCSLYRVRSHSKLSCCLSRAEVKAVSPPAHQRSALESIHLIYEISTPRRQTSRKQHEVLWLLVTELLDPLFFFLGILGSLGIICLVILCSSTFTLMQFSRHPNPAQCHLSETDKNCRWQKKVI